MSWIARSIANSLKLDDDYEEDHSPKNVTNPESESDRNQNQNQSTADTPRGVKEDLSELTKSFSRQIWGVASFLAPPPQDQPQMREQHQSSDASDQQSDPDVTDEAMIDGIKSDFAEIRGKFQSGISKLSNNISVSEITKMASTFLQFGSETEPVDAVGVTEEVLMFARNIAVHPETWLDFPVPDEEDFDDFDMTDVQQEHALAVERLAPMLAALRMELCPEYMSENCFWKIYFVLLHPRLNKNDAELLSTPQIVETRAMLAHELQNRAKTKPEPVNSDIATSDANRTAGDVTSYLSETAELPEKDSHTAPSSLHSESMPLETSAADADPSVVAIDFETEKYPVQSNEMQIVDKSVVREEAVDSTKHQHSLSSSSVAIEEKFEDDGDDWLKEESSEMVGMSGSTMQLGNDEDVSFSDLEEDDGDVPVSYKKTTSGSDSSTKDSRDWVQLSRSSADSVKDINPDGVKPATSQQVSARNPETKVSNDWLDVDDIDEM
ncbi:putative BSD domain-containing protein [Melia azedarach]|uniref:BSD domain-containing protein n=1 Tax=Melia azedarach TaxID=155640 RepID=A0ACC1XWM3_MELAZ|nr:putative BSD domain-containing protein [Melia azedarach]